MGWTGNFETRKEALNWCVNLLKNCMDENNINTFKKVEVFNYQDIVCELQNNQQVYFCILYFFNTEFNEKKHTYKIKYMDHSVGPFLQHKMSSGAKKLFLSNPAYGESKIAKEFIDNLRKEK